MVSRLGAGVCPPNGGASRISTALALATEIALEAWQCRERKGPPDRCHDLLKLCDGLSEETRSVLQAACPEQEMPGGMQA